MFGLFKSKGEKPEEKERKPLSEGTKSSQFKEFAAQFQPEELSILAVTLFHLLLVLLVEGEGNLRPQPVHLRREPLHPRRPIPARGAVHPGRHRAQRLQRGQGRAG